jgi:hypothetical protein
VRIKIGSKGCLVAYLVAVAFAVYLIFGMKQALTPRNLAMEDPRQVFESFICSPPLQSAKNIKATGTIAFAGGDASIEFQLEPRDFDELIRRGKFRLGDDKAFQWIREFQPEGVSGTVERYVRINEGMKQTALFVSEDHRRAWFYEIHF